MFRPNVATFKQYDLEVLQDLLVDFVEITGGVPRPYMCDNRHVSVLVNKEEKKFMSEHFEELATEFAMISSSSIMRVLLNSYYITFKPKMKMKLFRDEASAAAWLLAVQS